MLRKPPPSAPIAALYLLAACSQPQEEVTGEPDEAPAVETPDVPISQSTVVQPGNADPGDGADDQQATSDLGANPFVTVEETGWLTIGSDGAVQTTYFDSDGRYRDRRNGEPVAQGSWRRGPDDRLCFEPDAGRGACWSIDEPDEDGVAIAEDADGKTIAIRRVAYLPPEGEGGNTSEADSAE